LNLNTIDTENTHRCNPGNLDASYWCHGNRPLINKYGRLF